MASRSGSLVDGLPPITTGSADGPHNRQTPTRRNLVPRTTAVGLGATTSTLPIFQTEGVSVDEKLNEQFRYFRSEYVEAANTSGVAVPLVIVEDKSGQVYKFVYHGGPKYLFEVIQANLENIHLLRCSLSLLIIIITLLRRKLPEGPSQHKESTLFSVSTSDSITAWIADTLAKIGDASAVSICINVLITSYNPSVQELALSLLASMLMVSDDAVAQMLLPYSSSGTVAVTAETTGETVRKNSNRRGTAGGRQDGVEVVTGGTADIAPVQQAVKPKAVDFKKLNFSYNTMDYSSKKPQVEKPKKVEKTGTCLSYVLSVILLQKNRHLLAAGCADIILAMLRKNKREMSEAIANTPTCELPAIDDRKSKNDHRSSLSKFSTAPEESAAPTSNPLSTVIIEGAGLKLLLKFLFRYEKMNAQSKTATKAIIRESVSASLHLKEEYQYAHSRVFTAVCQLIASSPAVAAMANKLEGAEDLLAFTFNRIDPSDSNAYNTFTAATNALAQDKALQARRRAHQLALQRGLRPPADGDLRLSDYLGSEGQGDGEGGDQQGERAVTPKELYKRLHGNGKTPNGSVSPSRSSHNDSLRGKKHKNSMQVSASADGRLGSLPRKEVLSDSVELGRNIKVNFQAEYAVETEKRELYLLNSYDAKYGTGTGSTGLKEQSKQVARATAQTPLAYHPDVDPLLGSSLESIGVTALRPITNPRPQMTEQQRKEMEFLLGSSVSAQQSQDRLQQASSTVTYTNSTGGQPVPAGLNAASVVSQDSSSYPGGLRRRADEAEQEFADSLAFFSSLPPQPAIPLRIEPKDVITQREDLTVIREKFKALADQALKQSKGKIENSRESQQELIKRVYGPRKFKFYDPKAPSIRYDENGEPLPADQQPRPTSKGAGHSRGKNQADRSRSRSPGAQTRSGIAPIVPEGDYFASFSDASGTALQDLPIQPGGPKSSVGGGLQSIQGLEGMDFSVEHLGHFHLQSSSATSDGPELYGLRLENFDFDKQNLFEDFKPIFSAPVPEKSKNSKPVGPDQTVLDELGIGRKNKPEMEMAQTVDLILS